MIKITLKKYAALVLLAAMQTFSTFAKANESPTVEWAPFELKENIKDEQLLASAQRLETLFLNKQEGYIKRDLLKGKNGQWVDLIYWTSEQAAQQAATAANNSHICLEYFALMKHIENAASGIAHYTVTQHWQK